jgi:chaperone required for assembly of F1-ATPase
MKRFWSEARAVASPSGWGVHLDGKPLRLPDGPVLLVPRAALADAVAEEWQAAGIATGEMDYNDVPLTRLAGTAQLRIVPDPEPVAAAIAAYGESDLLCYRADTPPPLVMRQDDAWTPWIEWVREELGVALTVTTGIIHVAQSPDALAALRRAVDAENGWALAGLGIVVPALGSLVLGLAVARGALPAAAAHELSRVDEAHQAERWGEDAEAEKRRLLIATDIADAARYMELVR